MKVFISWSGERSRVVAELMNDWIKCVLQASKPWISTRDIDRGSIWFAEISNQLRDTAVGIVCLTKDNKNKPWILFEAGALAKGLSTSRVCTFLIDLQPAEIEDPLAQLNHTTPDKHSMWALVRSLNSAMETNGLDERVLQQVFETYWPQFEARFAESLASTPEAQNQAPRSESSILEEILSNTRSLASRIRKLEAQPAESNSYLTRALKKKFVDDLLANTRDGVFSSEKYESMTLADLNKIAEFGPKFEVVLGASSKGESPDGEEH